MSTAGRVAAALVPELGIGSGQRESGAGRVVLTERPGVHALLAHARDDAQLGRLSQRLVVRRFPGPAMSDVLVAPAWETPVDSATRSEMIRRAPRDLVFLAGVSVRAYVELYGLGKRTGRFGFRARFLVLRTSNPRRDLAREAWEGATAFEFERNGPASGGVTRLALDIQPGDLPRGTYLLRVEVLDPLAQRRIGRSGIAFEVR